MKKPLPDPESFAKMIETLIGELPDLPDSSEEDLREAWFTAWNGVAAIIYETCDDDLRKGIIHCMHKWIDVWADAFEEDDEDDTCPK
jgi:hypothetical protein